MSVDGMAELIRAKTKYDASFMPCTVFQSLSQGRTFGSLVEVCPIWNQYGASGMCLPA